MKKFKKIIVCVLALCIVSASFYGCKDEKADTTSSETSNTTSDTTEASESESIEITRPEVTDEFSEFSTSIDEVDPADTVPVVSNPETHPVDFDGYIKANSDTVAWLKIPGTYVNYPVFQADDNDFYLHRNAKKEYSYAGSLFADYRNVITGSNTSDNVVIYGHNMADGSYFGSLNNFRNLSFYKQNPIVQFTTPEEEATYVIVAVFYVNAEKEQDNGIVWNYFKEHDFDTTTEFNTWKDNVSKRSFYTTTIDYNKSDKYLTLSTCSNVAGKDANARLVVIARKTRANEKIDTNEITRNPDIYLPASWDRTTVLNSLN